MRDLERLQRDRYLILRSLRLAHAFLNRLETDSSGTDPNLPQLVDFLHHFACEHFFNQEEALLEALLRRRAEEVAHRERLCQLRRDHELGRAIVASVQAALGQRRPEPRRVRVDLGKLIRQLSHSLVRGQDAVHTIEVRFGTALPEAALPQADLPAEGWASGTGDGRIDSETASGTSETENERLEDKYRRDLGGR